MFNLVEELAAYLPMDRRHALASNQALPDTMHGACVFADVSGFTRMTEELVDQLGNRRGAEELSQILDQIYTALIDEVHNYQGSVIAFSGDAITCWFADQAPFTQVPAGRRAVKCAQQMQVAMRAFADMRVSTVDRSFLVRIKALVTSGKVQRFSVGETEIQWLDAIAGPPIDRISDASALIQAGEIWADEPTLSLIQPEISEGDWLTDKADNRYKRLFDTYIPVSPGTWPQPELSSEHARELGDWLLPTVYERLASEQGSYLSEFRKVTSLMMRFDTPAIEEPGAVDIINQFIVWVQKTLVRYDGAMLDFSIGDKGASISAGFGAPLTYENDTARGLAAALELRSPPDSLAYFSKIQIGLSRGWMRVGALGSQRRRTYGVQGNEINVAARMMSQAMPGQIIATKSVIELVEDRYRFTSLGSLRVKNIQRPIPAFSVEERTKLTGDFLDESGGGHVIGRELELQRLHAMVDAFSKRPDSAMAFVLGEAGIGKTTLALDVLTYSQQQDIQVLNISADPIEQRTPYYVWRSVFRKLLNVEPSDDSETVHQKVFKQIGDDSHYKERVVLLETVLSAEFSETAVTHQMTGAVRANNTTDILLFLLGTFIQSRPLIILIDDLQWLDSASWRLVEAVHNEIPQVCFILFGRPEQNLISEEYTRLQEKPGVEGIFLRTLSNTESTEIISRTLGGISLTKDAGRFFQDRTQGNPYFLVELALALRDSGFLKEQDGVYTLSTALEDRQDVEIPETIHGVVTSRLDRLAPTHQLTLKVASVIGRVFAFRDLSHIHPVESEKKHLLEHLKELEAQQITTVEIPPPDLHHIFKHAITHEVVYQQLLFDQRKSLHKAIAGWLENVYAGNLSERYPLLAYHWRQAEIYEAAIYYLDKAGEQALRSFANIEAIEFFTQAIFLTKSQSGERNYLQLARWESGLGDAYYGQGEIEKSIEHFRRAAQLLDRPEPKSTFSLGLAILRELLRQEAYRRGLRSPKQNARDSEQRAHASQVYEKLSKSYYYTGEQIHGLHAVFRSVNLAESVASSADLDEVLARGYASVGAGYQGALRLRSLGEHYLDKSQQIAEDSGNADALGWSLTVRALIDGVVNGAWEQAAQTNERALKIRADIRDSRGWEETIHSQIFIRGHQGKLDTKQQLAQQLYAFALQQNDAQYQVYGLGHEAMAMFIQGEIESALSKLAQAERLLGKHKFAADVIFIKGITAWVQVHSGQMELARQYADEAVNLIERAPVSVTALDGYLGIAECYLYLMRQAPENEDSLRLHAQQAIKALQNTTRQYEPVRQAQVNRLRAQLAWSRGKHRAATAFWRKGLNQAETLGLQLEIGRTQLALGLHSSIHSAERHEYLTAALQQFERIGARLFQTRVEKALINT